jgi:endoglucanase
MLKRTGILKMLTTSLIALNSFAQPVAIHGALSVNGNRIVNKNGQAVSFAGNSLFWSNDGWGGEKYYNANVVSWLRNDWNAGIIRAAMGVEDPGGYLESKSSNVTKVKRVVDAAITNNMYVLIDWHSHNAEKYPNEAIEFFTEMAQTYGKNPHVIYEIYNEPIHVSWSNTIKPYAERVIDAIRAIDPDNLIIVGTPKWSANVDEAANDPIQRNNIAYTIHFYAAQHKQDFRNKCQYALDKGVALFATEWGTVNANGDGAVDENETNTWMDFLKRNQISHCNWSINDKLEGASALTQGASRNGNWSSDNLTWSGSFVRNILKSYDYGKVVDEISFSNTPIITSSKLTYTLKIAYTATQNRDLNVSFLNKQGLILASSKTQVSGSGEKEVVLNLDQLPDISSDYSYTCEIRPVGGNESTNLEKKTISNVTIVENEPLAIIEAESYNVMSGVKNELCVEGGENVAYLEAGDWLSYSNVTIPTSGTYTIYYRVASAKSGGIISLEKDAGKTILGTITVGATGDWQVWKTISKEVTLQEGQYDLGIGVVEGGYNLNMFAIAPKSITTNIDENDFDITSKMSVYPSPTKDKLYVKANTGEVGIFNLAGEKLIESTTNAMDVSMLPSGVYFLKSGNQTHKFIKE